ncbi:MAG: response regulator [Deltaproteobacteria bacterium]|nr:response regulator [Deltaproteobacteria bacterium]
MKESMKVMIVDDEEDLITTLVERLEIRGFDVVGLQTGQQAIEQLKQRSFDVVVLDVKLKGEDGVEVMKLIKHDHPTLPVILLSGHMSQESSEEGFRAGAIDYLIKPINIEDLIKKLQEAVKVYG